MSSIYDIITTYIDEHIREDLTPEMIANYVSYSLRYVHKLFNKFSPVPLMDYVRREKMCRAAAEFFSGRRLTDIAFDYGYSTQAGFFKAFRSVFGCSPSAYKRKYGGENIFIKKTEGHGMKEQWNNNIYTLNGRVKPPIVLRSEAEEFIARNAHNLIWENHRDEYDAIDREIAELKKENRDAGEGNARMNALNVLAKREIDALIIAEINAYRAERSGNTAANLVERLEKIEKMLKRLQSDVEDTQSIAEETSEAMEDIKALMNRVDDPEKKQTEL